MQWLVLCACVLGCSSTDLATADADVGSVTDRTDPTPTETPTVTDDTAVPVQVDYWSLGGTLAVLQGEVQLAETALVTRTWSAVPEALCSYDVPVLQASSGTLDDPDVVALGWWTVDLGEATGDAGCEPWPARTLELGLGPIDERLDPGLDAQGWVASSVQGLYLREAAGPLYLVGVAGTAAQLRGEQPAFAAAPLDGLFQLHTVILLDLP
jgi:hypothetical protein